MNVGNAPPTGQLMLPDPHESYGLFQPEQALQRTETLDSSQPRTQKATTRQFNTNQRAIATCHHWYENC